MPADRSDFVPKRSCPHTAWPKPPWRCRSPNAAKDSSSTRWTPTCSPRCTARCRRLNGKTTRLTTLGPLLAGLEARVIDELGDVMPTRAVGVIEVRGDPVTRGYVTASGFIAAQDEQGWYDTGDLGYLTEKGHVVVCGRVKDVIIMAGRSIYPTDVERAAARVVGVRAGCAIAIRLDAGQSRESFAVAVESNAYTDTAEVRRIKHDVAHEVVAEVDMRPRNVAVLAPGVIPKTPSGKLRRAYSLSLLN